LGLGVSASSYSDVETEVLAKRKTPIKRLIYLRVNRETPIPIQLAEESDSRKNRPVMTFRIILSAIVFGGLLTSAIAADKLEKRKSPKGAKTYIAWPKDGKTVGKKFTVRFGLKGMGVAPAGIDKENTGHHHLLIDVDKMPNLNIPLAASDNIRHFGGGQTEVTLELPPGKHTLQLVLGDWIHLPHNPAVISEKITITVKK